MRRVIWSLAAVALVAVVVIGLTQAGGKEKGAASTKPFDLDQAKQRLAGAPAPLAALHAQANTLLPGGKGAFEARLRKLRGHPVVINKWASWCRPCRAEFPIFEQVATDRGKRVAFVGLNGKDKEPAAREFLRQHPLPYPSYQDEDESIARSLKAPTYYPMTVFLDARGKWVTAHAGEYTSTRELEDDIDRYLG